MRYSHQRELIVEVLHETFDHPTADMIYERVKKKESSISLGTVYRNLNNLVKEGVIDELNTKDKKVHYDANTFLHAHFICDKCGEIFDIDMQKILTDEFKKKGFLVLGQKSIYYGVCNKCLEKEKNL